MVEQTLDTSPWEILNGRYKIQQQLGKKAGRQTLLADDLDTQQLVVIKLLTFSDDFQWDDLKLFEREAETLKALSHPAIPRYLDWFELDGSYNKGFALVQNYINALSLEQHLQAGRSFSQLEVKQLAQAVLDILIYLHSQQPAVIHRDLKPSNILLTNHSGNTIGQVYLVDFGSVQTLAAKEGGTMTIVGTYGYMPPEQFGGRAVPASDLYSLGATLIYLVTGTHPAELLQQDLRIQFEPAVQLDSSFVDWLKWMTEPSLERRLKFAQESLQVLEQQQLRAISPILRKPVNNNIIFNKDEHTLEIITYSMGLGNNSIGLGNYWFLFKAYIDSPWYSLYTILIALSLLAEIVPNVLFILGLFFIGFLLLLLFSIFTKKIILSPARLRINDQGISLTIEQFRTTHFLLKPTRKENILKLQRIKKIEQGVLTRNIHIKPGIILWVEGWVAQEVKIQKILIGGDGYLTEPEVDWIAYELSKWLNLPITGE